MSNPALALPFAINNALVPKEGPKGVNILLDFPNLGAVIDVDLSNLQSTSQISFIQGFYCDNSAGDQPIFLKSGILGQVITIPAGAQMYSPFLLPNPPSFIAQSASSSAARIVCLNVPLPFGIIPSASGGTLTVSDPALEALIQNIGGAGNALNVNVITSVGGSGASVEPAKLVIKSTITNSTPATSANATAGNVWYVTAIDLQATPDIASATAAMTVFAFEGGGGGGLFFCQPEFHCPSTAGTDTLMIPILSLSFPEPLEMVNLGVNLNVELSNALTSGHVVVQVWAYQAPPS